MQHLTFLLLLLLLFHISSLLLAGLNASVLRDIFCVLCKR